MVAACRSSDGHGGSRTVTVNAFGGDVPEPGVTVIGHSPEGQVIDQTNADAVGRASIGVDDDSLISVIFPGTLTSATSVISIVTVPAPDAEVTVYGPATSGPPPLIVGVLQVDGPNLTGAQYFTIQIGCATVRVAKLPATIDVGACSLGSDSKLDALVTGYQRHRRRPTCRPARRLRGRARADDKRRRDAARRHVADDRHEHSTRARWRDADRRSRAFSAMACRSVRSK